MNRTKKFIIIILAILVLTVFMQTKVFASTTYEDPTEVKNSPNIGDTIKISEQDMRDASNIYCVARLQHFGSIARWSRRKVQFYSSRICTYYRKTFRRCFSI